MPLNRGAPSRLALVVLGSHRSGTSAITRVLSLAGAALPARHGDGAAEPGEAAAFDERLLERLGSSWSDPFGPRRGGGGAAFDATAVAEARGMIEADYGDASLIVFDDPRATRVADVWKAALGEAGYQLAFVIPVRSPLEVAQAMQAQDGFTRNRGLLLWTSYMLAAERATRGERRVFVAYDRLVAEPEATLDRMERKLGFRFPRRTWESAAETERVVRAEPPTPRGSTATLSGALDPVRKLYDHLQAAAEDLPENEDVTAEVGDWFSALEQTLAPVLKQVEIEARHALDEQATRLREAEATSRRANPETQAAQAEVQALRDDLASSQAALDEARRAAARADDQEAELERLRSAHAGGGDEREAMQARLSELEAARDAALSSEQDQLERFADLEAAAASLQGELDAATAAEAAAADRLAAALAHAEALEAERDTLRGAQQEAAEQLRQRLDLERDDAIAAERARRRAEEAEAALQQERSLLGALRRERDTAAQALATAQAGAAEQEARRLAAEAELGRVRAALEEAATERDRLREAEVPLCALVEASRAEAAQARREGEEALRTVDERTALVESALRISRRRSAETEELLQGRITAAQAETREARLALAHASEARDAAEAQHEARRAEAQTLAAAQLHEERVRYAGEDAALRERLAETGVAAAAAQARVRELQTRLEETAAELEAQSNRGWWSRLFRS